MIRACNTIAVLTQQERMRLFKRRGLCHRIRGHRMDMDIQLDAPLTWLDAEVRLMRSRRGKRCIFIAPAQGILETEGVLYV